MDIADILLSFASVNKANVTSSWVNEPNKGKRAKLSPLGTLADGIDLMACQGNMEVLFPFVIGIADRDGIGIVIIAK